MQLNPRLRPWSFQFCFSTIHAISCWVIDFHVRCPPLWFTFDACNSHFFAPDGWAKVKGKCVICRKNAVDVEWYEEIETVNEVGFTEKEAVGDMCLLCGVTSECFPKLRPAILKKKYVKEPSFKQEFDAMSARIDVSDRRRFLPGEVVDGFSCSVEVYTKLALIPLAAFQAKLGLATRVKVRITTIFDPEGNEISGVLVERHSVPEKCPVFTVKLSASQYMTWRNMTLSPEDQQRQLQAQETFEFKAIVSLVHRNPFVRQHMSHVRATSACSRAVMSHMRARKHIYAHIWTHRCTAMDARGN